METLASAQEAGEKLMELSQKIGGRLGMPRGLVMLEGWVRVAVHLFLRFHELFHALTVTSTFVICNH